MDVSAFEADTGDPLTWREVHERLPEGVRVPVSPVYTRSQLISTEPH